jgi:hypothetical protein
LLKLVSIQINEVNKLKKKMLAFISIQILLFLSACGSKEELALDSKHLELPDYALNASKEVQEAYVMAAQFPEALASVPCYCGCYAEDGHISNLDCFVDSMGSDNAVTGWDTMGVS